MNEICFLNIDLDIESAEDLTPIIQEWEDRVIVFQHEKIGDVYHGSFETSCNKLEEIIEEYYTLVMGLTRKSKHIWDHAISRKFDFGYESGNKPNYFQSHISAQHVSKLTDIGGSIVITIYPVQNT
ncbi:hypothetical protein [Spartinivicinus ruber]|uniref:hypothetical protein n=1 Tax=Spartinivicinus ruber TaxID=2683272 RepID=UPI0013D09365|nr:hypothetical protein [Spartinivicinus ruber]